MPWDRSADAERLLCHCCGDAGATAQVSRLQPNCHAVAAAYFRVAQNSRGPLEIIQSNPCARVTSSRVLGTTSGQVSSGASICSSSADADGSAMVVIAGGQVGPEG